MWLKCCGTDDVRLRNVSLQLVLLCWALMFQNCLIMQVLLGLVLDIKNNRQRSQGTGGPLTISSVLSAGLLKWLKGCGTDEVQLRNLPWQLVLQSNKKVRFPQLPVAQ